MQKHALMNIHPHRITHSYNRAGVLRGMKGDEVAVFRDER
jgi:hypothetical protein